MDFGIIILTISSFLLFLLLTRKIFRYQLTTLFVSILFIVIPWQLKFDSSRLNQSLVVLLTSVTFLVVYVNQNIGTFKKIALVSVFLLITSIVSIYNNFKFDNLPFVLNEQDVARITLYQNIVNPVNPTLSRLYSNKATEIIQKTEINFFESFDLNNYFFANHPLERVGVQETEKFYSWLLPFFIVGCYCIFSAIYWPISLWVISVLLLSGIASNRFYDLNNLLIVPFLLIIGFGFEKIRNVFKH